MTANASIAINEKEPKLEAALPPAQPEAAAPAPEPEQPAAKPAGEDGGEARRSIAA
jgi:hypothetical protein